MKSNEYKKLAQKLIELDKKAEELDKVLQGVRIEINNLLWDFIEMRKAESKAQENKSEKQNLL